MLELLQTRAAALRLESRRSSLPQIASALKCWHAFSIAVLQVPAHRTLPPRSSADVEAFVAIFRSAGTAQNYVSAMKWVCTHMKLSVDWYSSSLQFTLQGARRLAQSKHGGPQHAKMVLTDEIVNKLVRLSVATAKWIWRPSLPSHGSTCCECRVRRYRSKWGDLRRQLSCQKGCIQLCGRTQVATSA